MSWMIGFSSEGKEVLEEVQLRVFVAVLHLRISWQLFHTIENKMQLKRNIDEITIERLWKDLDDPHH